MKIVASLVTTVVTKTNTINVYYTVLYGICVNFSAGCRKEIALK